MEGRLSRRTSLKFQYKFDCICEACSDNWPTYLSLSSGKIPTILSRHCERLLGSEVIEHLQKGDFKFACEQYRALCDLAEALEPYAPCKELADCQETLKQCLAIFRGLVSYGYSKIVEWKAIPPKV